LVIFSLSISGFNIIYLFIKTFIYFL
jgi:hypothetical protein